MPKGQLSRVTWPGTPECHSLSRLPLGASAAPQTFILTPASYSHSTSISLLY